MKTKLQGLALLAFPTLLALTRPADAAPPVTTPAADNESLTLVAGETPQAAFDRIYGNRIRRAESGFERFGMVRLDQQLLNDGQELNTPLALRGILLDKAFNIGLTHSSMYQIALDAANALCRLHPSLKAQTDRKILKVYELAYQVPTADKKSLSSKYLLKSREMADNLVKKVQNGDADPLDALNEAMILLQNAIPAARNVSRNDHADTLLYYHRVRRWRDAWTGANVAKRELDRVPPGGDEYARAAKNFVLHLIIDLDLPEEAGRYVGETGDPLMIDAVTLAQRDSATLTDTEAMKLGDWYRLNAPSYDFGKVTALGRAKACYERVLKLHAAKDKVWLEARANLGDTEASGEQAVAMQKVKDDSIVDEVLRGHVVQLPKDIKIGVTPGMTANTPGLTAPLGGQSGEGGGSPSESLGGQ